ncbi:ComEC/Rec2 family competence protein [Notoacmeibacter marinus]|uniref:ComEC/Rec2 family competence protein n=1 Tax=Notoacmeibacter marinus TaxID=1876515 RepID=UPI000DF4801A|nr:ComEC/Rec2 family competence protein [Notoacmeibacter marinus]
MTQQGEIDERALLKNSTAMRTTAESATPVSPVGPASEEESSNREERDRKSVRRHASDPFRTIHRWFRSLLHEEAERGSLFVATALLFAAGAFSYFALRGTFHPLQLAVISLPALFAALSYRGRFAGTFGAVVFAFICGTAVSAAHVAMRDHQTLGSPVATELTGRIQSSERLEDGRRRFVLDVLETARPALRYAPQTVRVTVRSVSDDLRAGNVVKVRMRLLPPSGPVRPGGFDFSFRAWFDGLGATGFAIGQMERIAGGPAPSLLHRARATINDLREGVDERIASVLDEPKAAIASALTVGYGAAIPDEEREALRASGLAHVLAISGLHMALAAGTVIGSIRLLLALFPVVAARWPIRKWAAGGGLAAASVYLLLSGGAIATQRSFIMLAIMLSALLFDRTALTMRNLALAMFLVVLIAPHEVAGPSFQMSFAATAALIAAYRAHNNWQWRRRAAGNDQISSGPVRLVGKFAAGVLATTLIAGAATTIFALWHFQRLAPLAPLGNLLAAPIISLLVMPMAVLSLLLMPLGLDAPFLKLMGEGIDAMLWIAAFVAELSPEDGAGLISGPAVLLLAAALGLFAILQTGLRWIALPLAIAGVALLGSGERPVGFILENGRAVGLSTGRGALASNRSRLSDFVGDQWMRALGTDRMAKPVKVENATSAIGSEPGGPEASGPSFKCDDRLCVYEPDGSRPIVWLKHAVDRAYWCDKAAIIIVGDTKTPKGGWCPASSESLVIDRMTLARQGSAALWRTNDGGWRITYAIADLSMPWHAARQWSRPARGLPDWEPRKRKTKDATTPQP